MESMIRKIVQIGIVTKDIKAMVKRYEEFYGIGGWMVIDGEKGFDPDQKAINTEVRGVPCEFEISLAQAMVGDVQIELIQPLDDLSDYARFLKEYGEGVHHICIDADPAAFAQKMAERNIPVLMKGTIPKSADWTYYDANDELGMIVEVVDRSIAE